MVGRGSVGAQAAVGVVRRAASVAGGGVSDCRKKRGLMWWSLWLRVAVVGSGVAARRGKLRCGISGLYG